MLLALKIDKGLIDKPVIDDLSVYASIDKLEDTAQQDKNIFMINK